jgi:hypothetical protein
MRFIEEREDAGSLETMKVHLRWLAPHLDDVELGAIDKPRIDAIAVTKRREEIVVRTKKGL